MQFRNDRVFNRPRLVKARFFGSDNHFDRVTRVDKPSRIAIP